MIRLTPRASSSRRRFDGSRLAEERGARYVQLGRLDLAEQVLQNALRQGALAEGQSLLARTGDGEPVGIAYGYPLSPSTGWWDRLITPVDDELRREDGRRTFGLMELAVRAPWRRLGVARRMHEAVLADTTAERVLLNARPDVKAAQAAYRSWGYRKVGEAHPWEGAVLHDVMVLDLRGSGG
ncbi:hypothetical protein GCM10009548_19140 [Streptomyces malaysiensis subsp. malaysiensis]|uniref:GNAT family N-acetyltransferase n=1 Tax=Streptomyces TaxID=1883 RepID=UPI001E2B56E9|nr:MULTISPECIES: GNAT family N-acetyltransferase [Streptomyces]UHH19569.1 hypothetical protein LUV23_26745 [Streptomyces sp. HNM0561]